MRKLELRVDELRVESFETLPSRGSVGTVFANMLGKPFDLFDAMNVVVGAAPATTAKTCQQWHTCEGLATCNLETGCYTWNDGYTCVSPHCSSATDCPTCIPCPAGTEPESGA
ncbi:MAG TPA: hypothetical protein VF092_29495 [Longimicrobium sp.]